MVASKLEILPKSIVVLLLAGITSAQSITITLTHGSENERRTKTQLERLLMNYNLSKYTFTTQVIIDEKAIPHSHPVLTLHTRHLNSDDQLLSTYVHEQLHWYLEARQKQTEAAETNLRKIYPKVPVGYPDGAQDEEGTYLHLIDCYLEMQADRDLMGRERASAVMDFWAGDHYRWVYKTVISDEPIIAAVIERENLKIN
jgi:hypothetical protein